MKVIHSHSAHDALPAGIQLLQHEGIEYDTRNGPALVYPTPVTTVYSNPIRRCVMWPERDTNIAFLIYEALWMLAGRNSVENLTRYVKDFNKYSDDKQILHGAYGYRWRFAFGFDQLAVIISHLKDNPRDRRNVLQIWDAELDLKGYSLDIPCNDTVTFQIDNNNRLNMVVFCRSNDIIWGTYFANAFHFGMLLEYMAKNIGCKMGTYSQISVNYHAYLDTLKPLLHLGEKADDIVPQITTVQGETITMPDELLDENIAEILIHADTGFELPRIYTSDDPWIDTIYKILRAHHAWRTIDKTNGENFKESSHIINLADPTIDWVILMKNWLNKRHKAFLAVGV